MTELIEFVGGPRDGFHPFPRSLFEMVEDGYTYLVAEEMPATEVAEKSRLLTQPGAFLPRVTNQRRHVYIKRDGKFHHQGPAEK